MWWLVAGGGGRHPGGAVDLVQQHREAEGHQRAEETQGLVHPGQQRQRYGRVLQTRMCCYCFLVS